MALPPRSSKPSAWAISTTCRAGSTCSSRWPANPAARSAASSRSKSRRSKPGPSGRDSRARTTRAGATPSWPWVRGRRRWIPKRGGAPASRARCSVRPASARSTPSGRMAAAAFSRPTRRIANAAQGAGGRPAAAGPLAGGAAGAVDGVCLRRECRARRERRQHDFVELNAALAALVRDPAALGNWLNGQRVFAPAAPG